MRGDEYRESKVEREYWNPTRGREEPVTKLGRESKSIRYFILASPSIFTHLPPSSTAIRTRCRQNSKHNFPSLGSCPLARFERSGDRHLRHPAIAVRYSAQTCTLLNRDTSLGVEILPLFILSLFFKSPVRDHAARVSPLQS